MQIKNGFLLSFIGLGISSCGVQKENDSNNRDVAIEVSPALGVTANAPKDVIYKTSSSQNSALNKTFKSWFSSQINNNNSIFRPVGNGGLGDDLNDMDALQKYDGIPISIKNDGIKATISISADGDKGCSAIFNYSDSDKLIKINSDGINTLTICKLVITASGALKTGEVINQSATILVKINPTMKAYAEANDPAFKYLQVYSSLEESNLIARWLKDSKQGNVLNLKYDKDKAVRIGKKLSDVNLITGAQNLKSIDLSGTDLKDLRAIALLNSAEKLDISDTKIDPKDLSLLADMTNLKSLAVRNLSIKDVTYITKNLKNLEELDISGNTQIDDLNEIANLKKLSVLKASNVGLKSLKDLKNLTQISSLDISNNDLSGLSTNDVQLLVNLYNISELNISDANISDEYLNTLFDKISDRNTLRKLTLSHKSSNGDVDCKNINNFDKIYNIRKLSALEYLDLHGNGCERNDYNMFMKGLKDTAYFSSMRNLKYIDISATAVNNLSGILGNANLKTIKIFNEIGGGISMTRDGCLGALRDFDQCYKLDAGRNKFSEFTVAGKQKFIVPANVYKIKVTACSGGDGGSGGEGGQGGVSSLLPNDDTCPWRGWILTTNPRGRPVCWASGLYGASGSSGGQGEKTIIEGMLETSQEYARESHKGSCGAGFAGRGGASGGINCHWWGQCNEAPQPRAGNSGSNGQNKIAIEKEFEVKPWQELNIQIGKGGAGGAGGAGGIFGWCGAGDEGKYLGMTGIACGWRGASGEAGSNGSDGYVKIEWLEL